MPNGGSTCLELVIPPTLQTRGRLHLKVNFNDIPEYVVNSVKEIHIQQDPLLIFVETDKPVYKPGQMVLFRVMVLQTDLTPVTDPIPRIWLENPSEVRLAQWSNVTTEFGLVQLQFQLSSEPLQGIWKIKVDHGQRYEVTSFEVREYVLPRFQVTITPPDYILADADYLQWKICAKYSYGQPVSGELHVKAVPQVPAWRQRKAKPVEIHYIAQLNSSDGCDVFNITGAELGLSDWDVSPNDVNVTATVTENGTGTSQNYSTSSPVLHQALKLQFAQYSSQHFKPGLPYRGKVKVLLQNDVPAPNELIQVCLKVQGKNEWSRTLVACQNFTSEENGFVHFVVPPQHKNIVLLSLMATAVEYNTKYYSPDKRWRVFMEQPTAFFDVLSWYSPSESYIMVNDQKPTPRCHHKHSFQVYYTTESNITSRTFYYVVKSRGDLIHFGQVNHTQGEAVRYYEDWFNILNGNDNNDTETFDEEKSVDKLTLEIFIKPKMSPLSYLMVYYIRDDGEIVADTYTLNIAKCFANKVNARFSEEEGLPGSLVTFRITTSVNSLCTVSAVDESTTYLASSNLIDPDKVLRNLARLNIDASSVPRQKDEWEYCAKTRKVSSTIDEAFWPLKRKRRSLHAHVSGPVTRYVDAIQAFEDFGVVVMTDLTLETRPCTLRNTVRTSGNGRVGRGRARVMSGAISPDMMTFARSGVAPLAYPLATSERREYTEEVLQSIAEVRTYFPETWLWDLVYVEKEIKMSKELPHTVTTWVGSIACISPQRGLGISPVTRVRSFQPFFLDYTVPYAIKRGEVVTLKVSLFNYLNDDAPVRIILEDSPGIEVLSEAWYLETCVESRSQLVHEFRVRAYELGEVNVTVSGEIDSNIDSINKTCGTLLKSYARDRIIKPLLVKAEGFLKEETSSSFICLSDSSNETSIQWNLTLPDDFVKDSARAEVTAVADLLGPVLQNLDNLVRLPTGCGEQNMILLVPNIHVIKYLKASKQENPALISQAVKNMNKGYQRELNYQHPDGSYSAFGKNDANGSMWLTAFVVKSFAQAKEYTFIDEDDLKKSIKWITMQQLENGCFPVVGHVVHKDIKGGLTDEASSAALTAYVLISLLETKLPLPASLASNVVYCLQGDEDTTDLYTLALSTYALTLLEQKELAEESLRKLLMSANKQRDLLWWEKPGSDSLALSIEITAYAVLSLVAHGGEENLINALKAIRWISKHRNPNGGFVSTQDTVVALEALTKYALAAPSTDTSLTVLVIANNVEEAFRVKESNRLLLQRVSLPVVPTLVEITAEGEGCVLVQANIKYNVETATGSDAFELEVETGPVASVDECTLQRVEACVRYKIEGETSNMAVLEVAMVTGYTPDRASLHKLSQNTDLDLKRWEEEKDQVNFYFDQLSNRRQCVSFIVVQEVEVENPAQATVKLYDYYHTELSITAKYSTDAGCKGERLPHPEPDIFIENSLLDNVHIEIGRDFRNIDNVNVTSDNTEVINVTSTTEITGLNPDFVNVDHELETPMGQEGPFPTFVATEPESQHVADGEEEEEEDAEALCPHCSEIPPEELHFVYCNSSTVYKVTVRERGMGRVHMNLSPGRDPVRLWKPIRLGLRRRCRCPHLETAGVRVIIMTPKTVFLNSRADGPTDIPLDGSYYIERSENMPGEPDFIKKARTFC